MSPAPSLRLERAALREGARYVAGMDEVGRGALAGPVTVGAVVVDLTTRSAPVGLRDSKLLTAQVRQQLRAPLSRWPIAYGVGHASAAEIDAHGLTAALRLAGTRALHAAAVVPDLVLLDGSHDWLSAPFDLFSTAVADAELAGATEASLAVPNAGQAPRAVRTVVKGDLKCASIAAASVLAKCARDELMAQLAAAVPAYGWAENKGYGSPHHLRALADHGPCDHHRRSWRLPTLSQAPTGGAAAPTARLGP